MSRRSLPLMVVAVLLALSPGGAQAQRRAGATAGAVPSKVVLLEPSPALMTRQAPSVVPYVLTGGLIGAGATAGIIWVSLARSNTECVCSPAAFAPVVAGGAVIGALVGAVVYAARRSARDRASPMRRASLD